MALLNPVAQQDIAVERPVTGETGTSVLMGALTTAAKGFFQAKEDRKPTEAGRKSAVLANLGKELSRAAALKDEKKDPFGLTATKAIRDAVAQGIEIPPDMQLMYEGIAEKPFEAFSYTDTAAFERQQLIQSESAQVLKVGVIQAAKAAGRTLTPQEIDDAVLEAMGQKALNQQALDLQDQKRQLGQPIEPTVILTNIQSDYQTLISYASKAMEDGVVSFEELRSMQLSANNIISTKYVGYKDNPEIAGVMEQMNKVITDLSVGVSTTMDARMADALQASLQNNGFDMGTIAVVRSMLNTAPETLWSNISSKQGKGGKGLADAILSVVGTDGAKGGIVDIFSPDTRPDSTKGTALIPLPNVKDNPDDYQATVDSLGQVTAGTDPTKIVSDTGVRNAWLKQTNLLASAVASQSDEYILGEKLLSNFASNSVLKNLDSAYRTDDINAAQTNDLLQQALSSERTRQVLELGNRTSAALGGQDLILMDANGSPQLNIVALDGVADNLPGGRQGWEDMKYLIDRAGGFEAFIKMQDTTGFDKTVAGSGPMSPRVSLDAMLGANFSRVGKLVDNVKLIDSKLAGLQNLSSKYADATMMYSAKKTDTSVTTSQGYKLPQEVAKDTEFLSAVDATSRNIGVKPEDILRVIDFETASSWSPAIKNPGSTATGLIQFLGSTAKGLGTTVDDLAGMSRAEQMKYVEKYLTPYKGRLKNFGDVYMAVHWPAGIGKDETYVMYKEGSKEYTANKNLDTNGDGTVTRGETIASVISRTGRGMASTPYTASAEQVTTAATETLMPPQAQGEAPVAMPNTSATSTPETISGVIPQELQAATQQQPQGTEPKTAGNTPIDPAILDTISALAQNANDVRVFATAEEMKQAYTNQEVKVGSLVVINGKLMSVTQDMVK
jgi:hypothetical protein